MAQASIPTAMPLIQYATILGISPWHFSQIVWDENPARQECRDIWLQYSHMWPDRASRESLARALQQAERQIAEFMGFYPAPTFIEQEQHPFPKTRYLYGSGYQGIRFPGLHDREKTIRLRWKHLKSGGRRYVDSIELDAPIVYSDTTGDGFDNAAEVDVTEPAPEGCSSDEVMLFPTTDTDPENAIRSATCEIADDGTITITGPSYLFVRPEIYFEEMGETISGADPSDFVIEGNDPTNFLDTVNVYRVYARTSGEDYAPVEFGTSTAGSVSYASTPGTFRIWNGRRSIIVPVAAEWNEDAEEWAASCLSSEPELIRVWYKAGWPVDKRGWITPPFARAIAALATAKMNKPICGCGSAEELAHFWQTIPASPESVYRSFRQLEATFGPQQGCWEAYKICQEFSSWGGTSV